MKKSFIFLLFLNIFLLSAQKHKPKDLVFFKTYKKELKGIYLARSSGDVLVHTTEWISLLDTTGKQLWKKKGFKYVCGAGISRDGSIILFQTSSKPKTGPQTLLNLTVHIYNKNGEELISALNPYRYFNSVLSPKGNYIVFGDPVTKKIYVYDRNLNRLWERETYLWYIGFDPDEQFIYDSAFGLILNMKGRRVWELPSGMKFLSISSGAEVVLSQPFLLLKSKNQIYLTNRVSLEQVIFTGLIATVSYDGSLVAYQDLAHRIWIWRTRDLIEHIKSRAQTTALGKIDFVPCKMLNFSLDDKTVFLYGISKQGVGYARLVRLLDMKTLWSKNWSKAPEKILVSEDNKFVLIQSGPFTIELYQLY